MKVRDILTDEVVERLTDVYLKNQQVPWATANRRALKHALAGACELTLLAAGLQPIVSAINDDGTWGL